MRHLALLVPVVLAGCVPQVAPPPAPAPVAVPPPAPAPRPAPAPADWRDRARTPGDWHYAGGIARYTDAADRPLLTLSCDRAERRVILTRPSAAAASAITVRTTSTVRALPVAARAPADAAPLVMLDAVLPAGDRLLDAMAFSRGRFAIEQAGQPALIVPAWAEIGRVVQDCR